MIWVADPTIKVAKLIPDHVFHVGLVEVVGESFLEVNGQSLVQKVEEGVDKRGWDRNEPKVENSLNEDGFVLLND